MYIISKLLEHLLILHVDVSFLVEAFVALFWFYVVVKDIVFITLLDFVISLYVGSFAQYNAVLGFYLFSHFLWYFQCVFISSLKNKGVFALMVILFIITFLFCMFNILFIRIFLYIIRFFLFIFLQMVILIYWFLLNSKYFVDLMADIDVIFSLLFALSSISLPNLLLNLQLFIIYSLSIGLISSFCFDLLWGNLLYR